MNPERHDIQSHNLLSEYEQQPKKLELYSLPDFAPVLRIVYPRSITVQDPFEENADSDLLYPEEDSDSQII